MASPSFAARMPAYQAPTLAAVLAAAVAHRGFSFVDVISDCPVYDGRYNRRGEGAEMLAGMKRRDTVIDAALAGKRFVPTVPNTQASPGPATSLPTGILHRGGGGE